MTTLRSAEQLRHDWTHDARWSGVQRGYSAEEVVRLRGTVAIEQFLPAIPCIHRSHHVGEHGGFELILRGLFVSPIHETPRQVVASVGFDTGQQRLNVAARGAFQIH